jgi:hypothetical protein
MAVGQQCVILPGVALLRGNEADTAVTVLEVVQANNGTPMLRDRG